MKNSVVGTKTDPPPLPTPVSSILINKNCSAVLKRNVPVAVKVRILTILLEYETENQCCCARHDYERCIAYIID
jgi:hypothetical protein